MATHSSVLVLRIPGTGEPGGLYGVAQGRTRLKWLSSNRLTATHFPVFLLHPTQLVVLTSPVHPLHDKSTSLLTYRLLSVHKCLLNAPWGRDLCWVLSKLAAASVLWPSASAEQGLSDSWRVHRCFRLKKSALEMPFFNKALLKLSEYYLQKKVGGNM